MRGRYGCQSSTPGFLFSLSRGLVAKEKEEESNPVFLCTIAGRRGHPQRRPAQTKAGAVE